MRLGQIHRNTFLEAPRVLAPDLSARERPHLFFAGQITGVEGYVESAACGLLAARAILDRLAGRPFRPPPAATALGALHRHLTGEAHPPGYDYQPTNVVFALFPPLVGPPPRQGRAQGGPRGAGAQGDRAVARPSEPASRSPSPLALPARAASALDGGRADAKPGLGQPVHDGPVRGAPCVAGRRRGSRSSTAARR